MSIQREKEPIRVLHMIGSLNMGGSQAMVINLYKAIDRSKVQFDFIIDREDAVELADIVRKLGAKIYTMPTFRGTNIVQVKKAWRKFFKEHPEYKILHSHVRSYASVYVPVAKKYGVKTIVHSHSTSNGKGILSTVKKIFQYPLRYQADYFFGCSVKSAQWLFGEKIAKSDRCYIVKNSIDTKAYGLNREVRELYRGKLGVGKEKVYMHVGRLSIAKNHMFMLDVFKQIHKLQPSSKLILVGEGELRDDIESRTKELEMTDAVTLLGNRKDVPELLQAADCFLFPSSWEGLPVSVVEAQAAGLPCFISDTITDEVVLTDLVKKLPIKQGENCWIKAIEECDFERRDVTQNIKEAGFDADNTSNWLKEFYISIIA